MIRRGVWIVLVSAAFACAVPVSVETNSSARMATPSRWSWLPRPGVPQGDVELMQIDERVRLATERELKLRGFRQAERGRPDLLLTYYVAVDEAIPAASVAYAAGEPAGAERATNASGAYDRGSLLLDVLDANTGRLLWRGVGRRVFDPTQTAEDRRQRIDDAMESIVGKLASR